MARPLSFLLLSLLLGLAAQTFGGYFLQSVAWAGLLLGCLDPRRSILWVFGMFLPHVAKLVAAVGFTLTVGTGRQIPMILYTWGYGHLHPLVHAMFGASIGVVLRIALSRLRAEPDYEPVRVVDAFMVAGFAVLAGGADRFASLYFEKGVQVRWPWSVTLLALAASYLLGLMLIVLFARRWLFGRPNPSIHDTNGTMELFFWGGVLLVTGFRQLMFEACFQVSRWDVTRCLTAADLPGTVMLGLGIGGVVGLCLVALVWEGISGNKVTLSLRPIHPRSAFSLGIRAVCAVILIQLGFRLLA